MEIMKNSIIIIGMGAIYNLYFSLLSNSPKELWNVIVFFVLAHIGFYLVKYVVQKPFLNKNSSYYKILYIFLVSSILEFMYGWILGLPTQEILKLVVFGIPITIIGLIYWWNYTRVLQKKLVEKQRRLLERLKQ